MKREIKFNYLWFNEIRFISKTLSIQDIEGGAFREMFASKELQHFSIKARRQFTGLKDSDGKEIFEGDIVQEKVVGEKKFGVGVIKWESPSFIVDRKTWLTVRKSIKVVGNIHENPELLDVEVIAGGPGHNIR